MPAKLRLRSKINSHSPDMDKMAWTLSPTILMNSILSVAGRFNGLPSDCLRIVGPAIHSVLVLSAFSRLRGFL